MSNPIPDSSGSLSRREFVGKLALGALGIGAALASGKRLFAEEGNPFAYDVSKLSQTDPKLIRYEEARRFPSLATPARHLEAGPDGWLYVAAGNSVTAMKPEGTRGLEIALSGPARCVTVAKDGTIFVGLRDHIEVFDPKGKRLAAWESPGKKAWFTGLAATESDLFAADSGNRVVLRYDRSGKIVGRIGEKNADRNVPGLILPSPYLNVKIHGDGLLRVNNPGRHRVEAYTFDGDLEGAWGKPSMGIEGFCGCCNPINLAVLPDGRMVTCEKGLPRVKIYSAAGEFESVVAGTESFPENAKVGAGERDSDASLAGLDATVDSQGRIWILDLITGELRMMREKQTAKS
ncbi:MAG: hypothetical protein WCP06_07870 [Verrucomicrobiota bacterium]